MNFKQIAAVDIQKVFLNPVEFAEYRTVIYQGLRYEKIPVCLQDFEESKRERVSVSGIGHAGTDSTPGLYRVSKVLYCALSDLENILSKKDA